MEEVVGKKRKEGNKEKKSKGACAEEVVGKKRKEGKKEKKVRVHVWRRKKEEGKKEEKKRRKYKGKKNKE